jgi:hypothetical protein
MAGSFAIRQLKTRPERCRETKPLLCSPRFTPCPLPVRMRQPILSASLPVIFAHRLTVVPIQLAYENRPRRPAIGIVTRPNLRMIPIVFGVVSSAFFSHGDVSRKASQCPLNVRFFVTHFEGKSEANGRDMTFREGRPWRIFGALCARWQCSTSQNLNPGGAACETKGPGKDCQLAGFSDKLPSMEEEIDDKMPSNSTWPKRLSKFGLTSKV